MRFDTVLIDVDDTLFDFRKSSFEALVKAFAEIGVGHHNAGHWAQKRVEQA